jgi:hypothetical protein
MWSLGDERMLYEDEAVEAAKAYLNRNPNVESVELEEYRPSDMRDVDAAQVTLDMLYHLEEYFYEHEDFLTGDDGGALFGLGDVPRELRGRLVAIVQEVLDVGLDLRDARYQPTGRTKVVTRDV